MHYLFNKDIIENVYDIRLSSKKLWEIVGLLLCLEAVLAFSIVGYIVADPVSITTLHIPVLIAAVWLGPLPSVLTSLVFGLGSLWQAEVVGGNIGDIIFAPSKSGNPFGSIVMNFGSRILFALIAAYAFRYFLGRMKKEDHFTRGAYVGVSLLSAALTFIHAAILLGLMAFFFPDAYTYTTETNVLKLVMYNVVPYIITGVLMALVYYFPHNEKLNHIMNYLSDYDRNVKASANKLIGSIFAFTILMGIAIYSYFVGNISTKLKDFDDIETIEDLLQSSAVRISIQTFAAFACLFIIVYILMMWISQYHSYSAIKANEQAVEAAERAKNIAEHASNSKSSFLFNMSHDIRTPMNAITGYARIARKHIDDKDAVEGYLDKIDMAGKHLLDLINDILDIGRIESGTVTLNPAPFNVVECANEVGTIVSQLAKEKNIEFTADIEFDPDTYIMADRSHLKQIVMNLLSNAIKYTPAGGKVNVKLEQCEVGYPNMTGCRYTVSDNGIGMSGDYLKIIFDPYTRSETKKSEGIQGTGLGMYIVKSLVELMGGSINVESELDKGTTITVEFCFDRAEPEHKEKAVDEDEDVLVGKRILLVDDNSMNREIATEILEDFGVVVDEAEDGEKAVSRVLSSVKCGTMYDLVLMDVQMPVMDGFEATKVIRNLPEMKDVHLPIVAMTANAFDEDRQRALAAGMDAHLAKPIDVPKLVKIIGETVGGR